VKRRIMEPAEPVNAPAREDFRLVERLLAGLEIGFHFGLKALPTTLASRWGGKIVAQVIRKSRPQVRDNAMLTLRQIEPGWPEERIHAAADNHINHLGQAIAEYSVIGRLWDENRIVVHGAEPMLEAALHGPLLLICLHTGHWDVVGSTLSGLGFQWSSFYAPRAKISERWVSARTRRRFGVPLLSPNAAGVRSAIRLLRAGRHVSIFCDEAREGTIRGPLFGRPPHAKGNLAVAARLSRLTGARIVFCKMTREPNCRFLVDFEGPITLPRGGDPGAGLLDDVAYLNGFIEPHVRRCIDQWFFLDNSFAPIR
jgi:Kdo2-lipid IVA lauroyltransferase/acyltransferase